MHFELLTLRSATVNHMIGLRFKAPGHTAGAGMPAVSWPAGLPDRGPNARRAAAGRDESRGRVHEKMVTMRRPEDAGPHRNKMVYICSLAFAMLAASPMRAAEPAVSTLLTPA